MSSVPLPQDFAALLAEPPASRRKILEEARLHSSHHTRETGEKNLVVFLELAEGRDEIKAELDNYRKEFGFLLFQCDRLRRERALARANQELLRLHATYERAVYMRDKVGLENTARALGAILPVAEFDVNDLAWHDSHVGRRRAQYESALSKYDVVLRSSRARHPLTIANAYWPGEDLPDLVPVSYTPDAALMANAAIPNLNVAAPNLREMLDFIASLVSRKSPTVS